MNLLLTFGAIIASVSAKVATCRNRLKLDDTFIYCSKFSAPANSKVEIEIRSRILKIQAPTTYLEDEMIFYEVGVFSDA